MADRTLLVALALLSCAVPVRALGTDRVILGKRLTIEDRGGPAERRVRGSGKETATDVPALSDPRPGGATLTVIAHGATESSETFILDASGWRLDGSGFRYTGPTGADGDPVKRVIIKRKLAGSAAITIILRGAVGTQPIDVVPPNPATSGGFILDVAGGDRYCVQLGGLAGGTTRVDDARRWDVRNATAEAGCPTVNSTTTSTTTPPVCGNGVREGMEQCDGSDFHPDCAFAGLSNCVPPGQLNECQCCVPPASYAQFGINYFPICCDGQQCQVVGPGTCLCPGTCGGSAFPACGGSCQFGTECLPVQNMPSQFCACVPPGPCDATCNAAECPAGEVCDIGVTCTCVVP